MLDARRLLTFREVARHRSFSRAAVALSLTQPAVSQQVRSLEVQIGERLIERRRGEFALTAAGELLLGHAEAVHARLELAATQVEEVVTQERRDLRLAAFPSALATLVPQAIARVRLSTEIDVSAIQGSTEEIVTAVSNGSVHVGLCFQDASLPRRRHGGTRRIDLLDESMLVALAADHRFAHRTRIRLAQLANEPWLAATRDGLIVRACRTAGFEPHLAYLTADPMAINSFVSAGLAVTLVSDLLAPLFRDVALVAATGEPPRRSIYALVPPGRTHPTASAFLEALPQMDG